MTSSKFCLRSRDLEGGGRDIRNPHPHAGTVMPLTVPLGQTDKVVEVRMKRKVHWERDFDTHLLMNLQWEKER